MAIAVNLREGVKRLAAEPLRCFSPSQISLDLRAIRQCRGDVVRATACFEQSQRFLRNVASVLELIQSVEGYGDVVERDAHGALIARPLADG
jgi:hypothetical protein